LADILLFNQYFTTNKDAPEYVLTPLPLNLLYVSSYIRSRGLDCKICELGVFKYSDIIVEESGKLRCGISDDEIVKIIKAENPKIIGVGCVYTQHFWDIPPIAKLIKKVNPEIKVVLGGNHATAFAKDVLKEPAFDYIVRGEGEITFYELCSHILSGKQDVSSIGGISYRGADGEIKSNPDRPLIKNLDELPIPDYSLVEVGKYASPVHNRSAYVMRYPLVGIMTSRGCPGRCVFCTVKAVWGRTWRSRSAKNTVDEIELLVKKYGVREISFLDDSVSVNRQRWVDICNEIVKRKINIKWTTPNGIAYWTLDNEILKLMKKAGCYRITFGIESGNEEIKKFIGKLYPLSIAKDLLTYANKIGLWTICTYVLGFPYDTKATIEDSISFAKISGTDFANFYLLAPHLTSDVYKYFKLEGLLNFDTVFTDNWMDDDKYKQMFKSLYVGGFATKFLTAEELKKMQFTAYRSFMIHRTLSYLKNPLILIRKIHSFEDLGYFCRMMWNGLAIFFNNFLSSKKFMNKSIFSLFYKRPKKTR
jgi:anaerobic magnesium-protoporphyrin IX monomethyl ester cyclase